MPELAALAEDGLVFGNAIAPSAAIFASATSFVTGTDPVERPGAAGGSPEEMKAHVRGHMEARRSVAEEFAEPYVFASTRMPNATVRGRDWKYVWSPAAEELYDLDPEESVEHAHVEDEQLEVDELLDACQDLVEWWHRAQAEKEGIVAAAGDPAEEGRV